MPQLPNVPPDTSNIITHVSFDPYSQQPSYKASAVELSPLASWET